MRGDVRIGPESIFCEYYHMRDLGWAARQFLGCGAGRGGGFPIGSVRKR
jgi:hypothetical protein